MMNTRTSSAPASTANGKTSHHEMVRHKYIRYHRNAYGAMVSIICQAARHRDGFWYLATIAFHAALFSIGSLEMFLRINPRPI